MVAYCGLRYKRAVIYALPAERIRRSGAIDPPTNLIDDRQKAYCGNMSEGSMKRVKKAFENLTEISDWKQVKAFRDVKNSKGVVKRRPYEVRFRINFITLTLPSPQGKITDRQIYEECFKPFIDALRYKHPDISYVWKAEVQKNGNIHFHITANQFVDYRWVRSNWNKQVGKLGFIRAFAKKHGHSDPNSTDIKAVRDDSDLGAYMAKYMGKLEKGKRALGIKVWDCSKNIKFREIRNLPICNEINDWIDDLIRSERVQVIRTDQAIILQSPTEWDPAKLPKVLQEEHSRYLCLLKDQTGHSQGLYLEEMEKVNQTRKTEESTRDPLRKSVRGNRDRYNIKSQLRFDFDWFRAWEGQH
jgi:hypothetical protein